MKKDHAVTAAVQLEIIQNFRRVIDDICTKVDLVDLSFIVEDEHDAVKIVGFGRNGSAAIGLCSACFWSVERHEVVARKVVSMLIAAIQSLDDTAKNIKNLAKEG